MNVDKLSSFGTSKQQQIKAMFDNIDTNGDGSISKEEIESSGYASMLKGTFAESDDNISYEKFVIEVEDDSSLWNGSSSSATDSTSADASKSTKATKDTGKDSKKV